LSAAHRALALSPDEPWAHAALGYALIWKHPAEAIAPCQRAIALNPNFAVGHYFLALASSYAQCPEYVFPHAEKAEYLMRPDLLAHGYSGAHNNVRATGAFAVDRYREGIRFGRAAVADNPDSPTAYRALIIDLAMEGEIPEAREALRTLRRLAPKLSQDWIRQNAVWSSDQTMRRYVEAFRAVGLK
jgi:adenylate cyclase